MQLQFNKTVIPCLKRVKREMQTQEQTQEVRLTDGMPDIGRVLASWGQPVIRSKEWHSGSAGVSGGVMVWVLYAPEDGGEPQCVESWLPIQMKWDLPDLPRDGSVTVYPMLRGVDARSLTPRKLMVRANMGALAEMMVPEDVEVYSPEETVENVQILEHTYPMRVPTEAGEKAFTLEETLSLPAAAVGISKLMRYTPHPVLMEQKIVTDKLVIRGVVLLRILYLGNDGRLHTWEFELPYSQYTELEREYPDCADARISFAVTDLELVQGEEESLNLKAGITAQYIIYDCANIKVAADMYGVNRPVEPQFGDLQLSAILDSRQEMIPVEQAVDIEKMDVVDMVFYPDQPLARREGDRTTAELTGTFQLLGYDGEGVLQGANTRWEGEKVIHAAEDTVLDMTVQTTSRPQAVMGGDGMRLRAELPVDIVTCDVRGIPMIIGAALGEPVQPSSDRPSLILRKAGDESLWEIAKRAGSTVGDIQKANGLEQDPGREQMLLIPVS